MKKIGLFFPQESPRVVITVQGLGETKRYTNEPMAFLRKNLSPEDREFCENPFAHSNLKISHDEIELSRKDSKLGTEC